MGILTTINLPEPLSQERFKQAVISSGADWINSSPRGNGVVDKGGKSFFVIYNNPHINMITLEIGSDPSEAKEMTRNFIEKLRTHIEIVSVEEEFD